MILPLIPFYQDGELITGRIVEILADTESSRAVIVLDVFQILAARHDTFGMPMLTRETMTYIAIPSTVRIISLALHSNNLTDMSGCGFSVQCTARLPSHTMYCIRQAAIDAGAC